MQQRTILTSDVSTAFGITIYRSDIQTLEGLNWLNDQVRWTVQHTIFQYTIFQHMYKANDMLSQITNVYFTLVADHCHSEKANCCRLYSFSSFFCEKLSTKSWVHWNKNMEKEGNFFTVPQPLPWFDIHYFYLYCT